ncbi:hypothetical protein MMIC_P1328 [Mariprofundus micogutta]|uniref:SH3b domain-containing protein n=1 Tax=Mariprofundus micogutta TaxID=1921010 RepID=A0A1L8CN95_9PROT|nr:SH3 domain-containing protein [Mariprofundus micogutta]GAV20363.1 hypothetical protein MMIC_P1328 [Mariprofundus micogutta]
MGHLRLVRVSALIILLPFMLSGCVAVTAVSAIPGAVFEVLGNQFVGLEKSFPSSMKRTLAAIQSSLRDMKLDIDVLEIQEDGGYGIGFGNQRLDGTMTVRRQTPQLTTVYIKVRSSSREESVETAITELIEVKLKKLPRYTRFSRKKYNNLRAKTSVDSKRVGWFRPGASLEVSKIGSQGWLMIKLPSGKTAYLKGAIIDKQEKNKRKSILSRAEK